MTLLASTAGDAAYWGLAIFLVAIGIAAAFMLFRLGQAFERLSSLHQGHRARPPARDREDGRHRRSRQLPARQGRHRDRQRGLDGGQCRHGGSCDLDGDHDAGRKGDGPRCRDHPRLLPVPQVEELRRTRRRPRRRRRASARPTFARTCEPPAARRWTPSGPSRSLVPRQSRSLPRGPGPRRYRSRIPCPSRPTSRLPRSGHREIDPPARRRGRVTRSSSRGSRGVSAGSSETGRTAGEWPDPGYDRVMQHDRRAPRRLPLVLRGARPHALSVVVVASSAGGSLDAVHLGRDAAAQALLLRARRIRPRRASRPCRRCCERAARTPTSTRSG